MSKSKLDDIFTANVPRIYPWEETLKQQIKDLFIELLEVGHTSDNDDELLEKLRKKVSEL